jgi:uncharacterized Zn finger protein
MSWYGFPPYVPVAQRRANALREVGKLKKKGQTVSPVKTEGRLIASTFWGKAWCDNLESYSDFSNRLPRGRTYVRNGSVVDLQIEPGQVTALVSGSSLYHISIKIKPLAVTTWTQIKTKCGREIGSLVELLRGSLSKNVMQIVTGSKGGLFPAPAEIEMSCSCPDFADLCKHLAATLYGVGNRLDHQPELLFKLRQVDHLELIAQAAIPEPATGAAKKKKTIESQDLASVFGIELEGPTNVRVATDNKVATNGKAGRVRVKSKPPSKSKLSRKKALPAKRRARKAVPLVNA